MSKWFMALYEIAHGPGISARHLQVRLSVSYKTAWRMLHQIRRALREEQLSLVLTGVVEADETYLGGRRKGPRGRGARGKTPVVGLAQRSGPLVALTLPDVSRKSLACFHPQPRPARSPAGHRRVAWIQPSSRSRLPKHRNLHHRNPPIRSPFRQSRQIYLKRQGTTKSLFSPYPYIAPSVFQTERHLLFKHVLMELL